MNSPAKPWSNQRQILWALGAFGLLFLAFSLFVAWIFHGGFGPGSNTSPPGLVDLLVTLLLSVPCIYYIVVAHRAWSRKLWVVGLAIHSMLFILMLSLLLTGGVGALIMIPFFLAGPIAWLVYAKRNASSPEPGQPVAGGNSR